MNRLFAAFVSSLAIVALAACSNDEPTSKPTPKPAPQGGHVHDDGTVHTDDEAPSSAKPPASEAGHGGGIIELGNATIGDYSVRASRDVGEVKAGGEAPIDVWLTGGTSKVVAVRFWIGTEDAAGSVKAKADIENPAEPNHWHTHAEVPSPMPAGAKLWVEIEAEGGAKTVGSFDLKSS